MDFAAPICCPFCKQSLDAATPTPGQDEAAKPTDGDISFCFTCGEWAIFTKQATSMRRPRFSEYMKITADKQMRAIRAAWLERHPERERKRS